MTRQSFAMARNMGLYEHETREAPCVQCGRLTTRLAITAYIPLARAKRFGFEAVPQCKLCWCDGILAKFAANPQIVALWGRYRRLLARHDQDPPDRGPGCRTAPVPNMPVNPMTPFEPLGEGVP